MSSTLTIADATDLLNRTLSAAGYDGLQIPVIVDHLIDCELRGLSYGGLPRALTITERVTAPGYATTEITKQQSAPTIASVDGGNQVGYLVAQHCTDLAIDMAKTHGLATVTARKTWYTGMFAYYLEQITRQGLIGMIAGNGPFRVAPHGGTDALFGTNPIAFGFPSADQPIIYDIGTSKLMHAEVLLAQRLGENLPPESAYNAEGDETRDPSAAFEGAVAAWGGHKGSGLATVVHLLGLAAGQGLDEDVEVDCGFFLMVIDPTVLPGGDSYRQRVSQYADTVRKSRPVDPERPVRMPFDGSVANRARNTDADEIVITDHIYEKLTAFAAKK